ncbi:DUF5641 domain-containing protein [Nephila pilipes]|uniref:DUF5641 domain-containing protein n=1 Tax=Nephila pilipes TaxID=299642 RepID=A0A8X6T9M8_NEPPI|nr:DUF5641 domain-containing protein [Nephila pilipes]
MYSQTNVKFQMVQSPTWLKENLESWPVSEVSSQPSEEKLSSWNPNDEMPVAGEFLDNQRYRRAIKNDLYNCIACNRYKAKSMSSGPTPQPPDRPFYPLEIYSKESIDRELGGEESNSNNVIDNEDNVTSAVIVRKFTFSGRPMKAPTRLDLLNNVCYTE